MYLSCKSYIGEEEIMGTCNILYAVVLAHNIMESTPDEF